MLAAQGADLAAFEKKLRPGHIAPVVVELDAERDGFVSACDARIMGEVVRDLGGGRLTKESLIQSEVGVDLMAKPGDVMSFGSLLCRVHSANQTQAEAAAKNLKTAFTISDFPPEPTRLICEFIQR
jgi:thymidine phosphorylase